jgi:DNA-binding Xre family transcriptional regulator
MAIRMNSNETKTEVQINRNFVMTLLAARGMTLRDLARQTDIGEATLYRLVNGATFKSDTLGRLALALECNPVDLQALVPSTINRLFIFQKQPMNHGAFLGHILIT